MTSAIFQPFWRGPSSKERGDDDAGLGLAIVDRVVRVHDGRVWAAHATDGGLVVTIELATAPRS